MKHVVMVLSLAATMGGMVVYAQQPVDFDSGIDTAALDRLKKAAEQDKKDVAGRAVESAVPAIRTRCHRAIANTEVRKSDGSIRICRPAVQGRWVSAASNLDGVCRHFKFQDAVGVENAELPIAWRPVRIGPDGEIMAGNASDGRYLLAIQCRESQPLEASTMPALDKKLQSLWEGGFETRVLACRPFRNC